MKKLSVGLAALLLSACGSERHYALDGPPVYHAAPVGHPLTHVAQPREGGSLPNVGSAGPLKTAMVGSYMDAQERDFRAHLRGDGVRVARIGDDLLLQLQDDVLFDGNDLSSDGRSVLERTAELLRHYDHTAVAVGGYTDTSGTPDQNMAVSQKRARLVADALVSDGVAGPRVGAQGYGASHLKIVTGPNKNEPRNRRIEIHIIARPQA
jgi:outer membrane protein OmpA-like peptidoglycan-associated protein